MNDVSEVFPTSTALVCRFHVKKWRKGEAIRCVEERHVIIDSFEDVLDSPNEEAYVDVVVEFRKVAVTVKFLFCLIILVLPASRG
ncbi:hypothetical protein L195_g036315 [Trifolium pratense]|uniref:Uncharacterized protein n=1 Tax=Trifolium pratense TaxID=57577 RepID=A0A2K3LP51_TRIPR|nr:hypothetical protein L195_g036315 [Trifolium pratense]